VGFLWESYANWASLKVLPVDLHFGRGPSQSLLPVTTMEEILAGIVSRLNVWAISMPKVSGF
jgi:hypothetical protein